MPKPFLQAVFQKNGKARPVGCAEAGLPEPQHSAGPGFHVLHVSEKAPAVYRRRMQYRCGSGLWPIFRLPMFYEREHKYDVLSAGNTDSLSRHAITPFAPAGF